MVIILIILLGIAVSAALGLLFHNRHEAERLGKQIREYELRAKTLSADLESLRALDDRKASTAQFDRLAGQIVYGINQGIVVIDQNHAVAYLNPFAEKYVPETGTLGKNYSDVLRFEVRRKKDTTFIASAFAGRALVFPDNTELSTQRGMIPVTGAAIPVSADNGTSVVCIFADNSESVRRNMEEKTFFSQAVHELRTPLTVIRLTIGVLQKQLDSLGREKVAEHLKRAEESAEHLSDLVNDFLNLSRLDQGKIQITPAPFDIQNLTEEIIREVTPLARERNLYIHHEPIGQEFRIVIGDRTKAKEILMNLVSNALKYTHQGGLTITHMSHSSSLATRVADTGKGIPMDQQSMLFKRFTQVGGDQSQSIVKSSGLGLYIAKQFALLMHGDVVLEKSEPGKGSTFMFTLPVG